jgi:hypothetical protein
MHNPSSDVLRPPLESRPLIYKRKAFLLFCGILKFGTTWKILIAVNWLAQLNKRKYQIIRFGRSNLVAFNKLASPSRRHDLIKY